MGKPYKTGSAYSMFLCTTTAFIASIDDMSGKLQVLLKIGAKVSGVTSVVDTLDVPYLDN